MEWLEKIIDKTLDKMSKEKTWPKYAKWDVWSSYWIW